MQTVQAFEKLKNLEGLKQIGDNQWTAICPCHEDDQNSLAIKWDSEKEKMQTRYTFERTNNLKGLK
jgi:hypothetical protein